MTSNRDKGTDVHGHVAPGFELVRQAFAVNLEARKELGAAFAATLDGELIADLWGGTADASTLVPWQSDTLQVIFSGTKALVAVCLLLLIDRGQLDLDAPVCRYWPEFAGEGKTDLRVLELVSHQARLPGLRQHVEEEEILDGGRMAALLARQNRETDPRAPQVYHALTYGWLCGELIRRVAGRSVGQFFADEVAGALGLDLWIGLPSSLEGRVSALSYAPDWGQRRGWDASRFETDDLLNRVWNNPPLFPQGRMPWNQPAWHQAEIPAAGGIGTARSLARLYGCLAAGGQLDGVRLLSPEALTLGSQELTRRWEPLLEEPQAFGVGFQLQTDLRTFGPPPDAFGHGGAGGSIHGAWPTQRVGFSYAMNLMRDDTTVDPRAHALLEALFASLTGR